VKIRVVSDGTPRGTRVENKKTGELLDNVVAIELYADVTSPLWRAEITLLAVECDITAEAKTKEDREERSEE
jgi:hypothetical protein